MKRDRSATIFLIIVVALAAFRVVFALDPVADVLRPITQPVSRAIASMQSSDTASDEQLANAQLETLLQENDQLRRAVELTKTDTQEAAEIIGFDIASYRKTVIINKGVNDGITVNDAVLSNGYLYGRVSEASKSSSVVQLIIDPEFSATAQYQDQHGVVKNEYGSLLFDLVPRGDIPENSVITTDGIDGVFRPGIPVAVIATNITQPGRVFFTYNTFLSHNPTSVRYVQVEKQ